MSEAPLSVSRSKAALPRPPESKRFNAIEGLRGWLAWTVVLSHVVQVSNIIAKGVGPMMVRTGSVLS